MSLKDEKRTRIIAVALQKGGVGKTTTAVNLGTVLGEDHSVLLIDADPQANATTGLGIREEDVEGKTINEVCLGELPIDQAICKTEFGVDVIPSCEDFSELDINIIENRDLFPEPVHILKRQIDQIKDRYDFIIMDLPPSLGLITVNCLVASTDVLIAMQCEHYATKGVVKLMKNIKKTREAYNPELGILGVVGTMFNRGTNLSSAVMQEARQYFSGTGIRVFDTTIYRTIRFGEAPALGTPAVVMDKSNPIVQAYRELAEEVVTACQA